MGMFIIALVIITKFGSNLNELDDGWLNKFKDDIIMRYNADIRKMKVI